MNDQQRISPGWYLTYSDTTDGKEERLKTEVIKGEDDTRWYRYAGSATCWLLDPKADTAWTWIWLHT